ncbi:hypothetical protein F4778DRAFT_633177 [Xylariomycetidae sp. FL2044]|nr:hypothetical protein F4778DRAFT_633177 [Xylariomycetidae sp. FL2044]
MMMLLSAGILEHRSISSRLEPFTPLFPVFVSTPLQPPFLSSPRTSYSPHFCLLSCLTTMSSRKTQRQATPQGYYRGVDGQLYEIPSISDTTGRLTPQQRQELFQYLTGHILHNDQGQVIQVTRAIVTEPLHTSKSSDPNAAAGQHMSVQLTNPTLTANNGSSHLLHFRPQSPEHSFLYARAVDRAGVNKLQGKRLMGRYDAKKKKDDKDKKPPPGGGSGAGAGTSSSRGGSSKTGGKGDGRSQYSSHSSGRGQGSSSSSGRHGRGYGYSYAGTSQVFGQLHGQSFITSHLIMLWAIIQREVNIHMGWADKLFKTGGVTF